MNYLFSKSKCDAIKINRLTNNIQLIFLFSLLNINTNILNFGITNNQNPKQIY